MRSLAKPRPFTVIVAVVLCCFVLPACRGDGDSPIATATATVAVATETASPSATAAATATPSIEDQVVEAYLAYWDAYADALLFLDASRVEEVTAEAELERVQAEVESLRADGVAARVRVEHDFSVVDLRPDQAVVVDRFVDRSFYVDPATRQPEVSDVPGQTFQDTFHMRRSEHGWVVVLSERER